MFAPVHALKHSTDDSPRREAYAHRFPLGQEPVTTLNVAGKYSDEDLFRENLLVYTVIDRRSGKNDILICKQPPGNSKDKREWIGYHQLEDLPPLRHSEEAAWEVQARGRV